MPIPAGCSTGMATLGFRTTLSVEHPAPDSSKTTQAQLTITRGFFMSLPPPRNTRTRIASIHCDNLPRSIFRSFDGMETLLRVAQSPPRRDSGELPTPPVFLSCNSQFSKPSPPCRSSWRMRRTPAGDFSRRESAWNASKRRIHRACASASTGKACLRRGGDIRFPHFALLPEKRQETAVDDSPVWIVLPWPALLHDIARDA